jgi:hypothetical protein
MISFLGTTAGIAFESVSKSIIQNNICDLAIEVRCGGR